MEQERLPFGKQISPTQIDLRELLTLASDAKGDAKALYAAVGKRFFPKPGDETNEVKSGMNAFLAMRQYGLVTSDIDFNLTEIAEELLETGNEDELNETFAKHILLNLHGLQIIEVIDSLHARGESVNVSKVARELLAVGIAAGGSSGENINPMRLWLERAGVLKNTWTVDSAVLRELTGASAEEISELVALPEEQQAILRALATVTETPPYLGSKLRELAELQTPVAVFDTKTFAEKVLGRLEAEDWISVIKATAGRGAKSQLVEPTQRFKDVVSEPLMNTVVEQVHLQDPASLRRPLNDLLDDVDSTESNHQRGLALEGVCIQIVRLLGARFLGWRLRGDQTGGAEVDVVADTLGAPYLLIQLQSKASAIKGREIVDREIGVAATLKSNVIVFVTARNVGPAARKAAATHMQESAIAIMFLEGTDLRDGMSGITSAIRREWQIVRAVRSKRGQQRTQSFDQ
jgi:hypothetical protein